MCLSFISYIVLFTEQIAKSPYLQQKIEDHIMLNIFSKCFMQVQFLWN